MTKPSQRTSISQKDSLDNKYKASLPKENTDFLNLQEKISQLELTRIKTNKLKQMIQIFKAFASRSKVKLKQQTYEEVIGIERLISSANLDTLKRYEMTMQRKLKLIESEESIAILEEINEVEEQELQALEGVLSTGQ